MANPEHLAILNQGLEPWNRWRQANPEVVPDLKDCGLAKTMLSKMNLSRADLGWANLYGADLRQANLSGADLDGANLNSANLADANLENAFLEGVDFYKADLTNANLRGAVLRGAALVETNLSRADLTGSQIYGISIWNAKLEGATESNLVITRPNESPIEVDNLDVAQFMYLLLNNEKIRGVIDSVGNKGVLILGRFTERKEVLEAIRDEVRRRGYLPIVFDFERPTDKDFTETVKILAGMSRFIIADITKPRSVPLEAQAVVPDYMTPFVPIIQKGEEPFSMFRDLWLKYESWVMEPVAYENVDQLVRVFNAAIVARANERLLVLRKRKAEEMAVLDASQFENRP